MTQYVSSEDWQKFETDFPEAASFLRRASLKGEVKSLRAELPRASGTGRQTWITARLQSLADLDAAFFALPPICPPVSEPPSETRPTCAYWEWFQLLDARVLELLGMRIVSLPPTWERDWYCRWFAGMSPEETVEELICEHRASEGETLADVRQYLTAAINASQ